jgi:hypothetical protein
VFCPANHFSCSTRLPRCYVLPWCAGYRGSNLNLRGLQHMS